MEEDEPIEHPWVTQRGRERAEEGRGAQLRHPQEPARVRRRDEPAAQEHLRAAPPGARGPVPDASRPRTSSKRGVEARVARPRTAEPELRRARASRCCDDMVQACTARAPPPRRRDARGASRPGARRAWPMDARASSSELRTEPLEQRRLHLVRLPRPTATTSRTTRQGASSTSSRGRAAVADRAARAPARRDRRDRRHDGRARLPAQEALGRLGHRRASRRPSRSSSASRPTGVDEASTDSSEIAEKLYDEAEAVLKKREQRGRRACTYLRVFRNFFLQEIDNQWLEHLQPHGARCATASACAATASAIRRRSTSARATTCSCRRCRASRRRWSRRCSACSG